MWIKIFVTCKRILTENYWDWKRVTVKVTQKVTINQQKILNLIKENPFITQEELSKIIGITRKSVISNMKKFQDVGLIKRIGADKNGYWQVEE